MFTLLYICQTVRKYRMIMTTYQLSPYVGHNATAYVLCTLCIWSGFSFLVFQLKSFLVSCDLATFARIYRISVAAAADLISNQAAGIGATFREKVNLVGPVVCQTIQKTIWRSHV